MADLTLTEALHRLHAAGRIVRRELPGMQMVGPDSGPALLGGRRWWRRTHHRWVCEAGWHDASDPGPDAEPVLTDAATCGCLLALWFEAAKATTGHHHVEVDARYLDIADAVQLGDVARVGQALAAALIALAEGL